MPKVYLTERQKRNELLKKRVAGLLEFKGASIEDWGRAMGLKKSAAYYRIKNISALDVDEIYRTCTFLGVKVSDFMDLDKKIGFIEN